MTISQSFKSKIRESAPAPPDETEDYRRFHNRFSVITMIVMIACAYLASLLPVVAGAASEVLIYLPTLNGRASFLRSNDIPSYFSFSATVVSVLLTGPLSIAVFARGYWITVVAPRKCRRVSRETFLSVAFSLSVSSILVAIAFVHVPTTYDPRWPGFSSILFWPLFPALGSVVAWMFSLVLFSALVGIAKAATQRGEKNG